MRVAGIDVSTFAIDIVTVDYDVPQIAHWHHFELRGQDAFDRTRSVADVLPSRASVFWDNILAVGIEEPAGRNPGVIFRAQGAVLAHIPARMLVDKLMPSQWRRAVGLAGNASKDDVAGHVHYARRAFEIEQQLPRSVPWPQDACDAYCIAQATRTLITTSQEAA